MGKISGNFWCIVSSYYFFLSFLFVCDQCQHTCNRKTHKILSKMLQSNIQGLWAEGLWQYAMSRGLGQCACGTSQILYHLSQVSVAQLTTCISGTNTNIRKSSPAYDFHSFILVVILNIDGSMYLEVNVVWLTTLSSDSQEATCSGRLWNRHHSLISILHCLVRFPSKHKVWACLRVRNPVCRCRPRFLNCEPLKSYLRSL